MRHDPYGFLTNRPNQLQEDWDNLLQKLQSMIRDAQTVGRADLALLIARQINILIKNKPNKKVYKSVLGTTRKIESELKQNVRAR